MSLPNTTDLLTIIEKERDSRVISYLTSNRQPSNLFPTKIADDAIPLFYEHLKSIGETKKISLFLNSLGGSLNAPWPIVNIIREFCVTFEVIIPENAKSAATLICLGANKIVMTPLSQLSPVDPEGIFKREGKDIRLEVENVLGFVDFVHEKMGLNEQESLTTALQILTKEIPADIIGSVNRTLSLIRRLSENLLKLHIKDIKKQEQINQIVENLTQKLFSHYHSIGRKEAKELVGLKEMIEYASDDICLVCDSLLKNYYSFMEEKSVFNPADKLIDENKGNYKANRAIIESLKLAHIFESHYDIKKTTDNKITINSTFQGWKEYKKEENK